MPEGGGRAAEHPFRGPAAAFPAPNARHRPPNDSPTDRKPILYRDHYNHFHG